MATFIVGLVAVNAQTSPKPMQKGYATYYADRFEGRKTASGEVFSQDKLTAAHRTLPLGSWVKVTNISNNRAVVVRINDRGPYGKGLIIDLSKKAASEIGMIHKGKALVEVEVVEHPQFETYMMQNFPDFRKFIIP